MLERSRRAALRATRVLRSARIIFNDNNSIFDCTVRQMSHFGATLELGSTFAVPSSFVLEMKPFKERYHCTVTRRTRDSIEVVFLPAA